MELPIKPCNKRHHQVLWQHGAWERPRCDYRHESVGCTRASLITVMNVLDAVWAFRREEPTWALCLPSIPTHERKTTDVWRCDTIVCVLNARKPAELSRRLCFVTFDATLSPIWKNSVWSHACCFCIGICTVILFLLGGNVVDEGRIKQKLIVFFGCFTIKEQWTSQVWVLFHTFY